MVKNKFGLILSIAMLISLVSCGETTSKTSTDTASDTATSSEDYVDPTLSAPVYDSDFFRLHYYRKDGKYDPWCLWLWTDAAEGAIYNFNGTGAQGAVASYRMSDFGLTKNDSINFIVRYKADWTKDVSSDRKATFSDFKQAKDGGYDIYLKSKETELYVSPTSKLEVVTLAEFTDEDTVKVKTNLKMKSLGIFENDVLIGSKELSAPALYSTVDFNDGKTAKFENSYKVKVTFSDSGNEKSSLVSVRNLYTTEKFTANYTYDGELGAIYSKEKTVFRVWSPVATSMKVRIYESGTPVSLQNDKHPGSDKYVEYDMTQGEKGVWEYTLNGDNAGKFYNYYTTNFKYQNGAECVDPYAKSTGINGVRGMIVDFSTTNPDGWDTVIPNAIDRKALTVYETHIADLTSSPTWSKKAIDSVYAKTYQGAYRKGTTYTEGSTTVKTGFDHIKELGVNAVQILPMFDQANDERTMKFNWGYNPLNYNVVEGIYSTDPYDGYTKIKELKHLISSYTSSGINIIMDVVYNHVNGLERSNFDILVPYYYYRYTSAGLASNGSGCGNETASDMPMFSKFMIDSTTFWTKEYKLGGFRFDLMGLHDLYTMRDLTAACKEINPNMVIYGEPWTGGSTTLSDTISAKQSNIAAYKGYGAFNDIYRDNLIKGGLSGVKEKGWATTSGDKFVSTEGIQGGIRGTGATGDPDKAVNYVTCHDNYTLYDRIKASGTTDDTVIKKMAMLANSVVFTSNGTSFMLAGEEFLRTKQGNSNSYDSSYEINTLDYALKIKNNDMFNNYKTLINFKQTVDALHNSTEQPAKTIDITLPDSGNMMYYDLKDDSGKVYRVIHRNGYVDSTTATPTLDLSNYTLVLDTLNKSELTLSATATIDPYQTLILLQK